MVKVGEKHDLEHISSDDDDMVDATGNPAGMS